MTSSPSTTVVIPSYGRPEQLIRAVSSVRHDAEGPTEILVVDDASPPGPPQAADFDDGRVRVLCREENGGVAAAQNTGLEAATGTYVAFLHSDDAWLPNRLERQITSILSSDAAAVESPIIRRSTGSETVVAPRMQGRRSHELLNREVRNLHISGWLFRRDALLEIGGFDDQLRCYEDLDLLIRLTQRFDITTENGPPVASIDTAGTDRLASSHWMGRGRHHLVRKYLGQFNGSEGLPPGWRDWCTQVAADLLAGGADPVEARDLLRRARRDNLRRSASTFPLFAGTYAPALVRRRIAATYSRSWR